MLRLADCFSKGTLLLQESNIILIAGLRLQYTAFYQPGNQFSWPKNTPKNVSRMMNLYFVSRIDFD